MKIITIKKGYLFLSLVIIGFFTLTSCAKKDTKAFRLLSPDSLSTEEINYITGRGLVEENEKIIFVYTLDNITNSGTVLTTGKIAVYDQEKVVSEDFENIFDMKKSHSLVDSINSTITIAPKENDEFTAEFRGGSDSDEKFFEILKDMWRMAISSKQEKLEKSEPEKKG